MMTKDEKLAEEYANTVKCEWENDTYYVDCRDEIEEAFLAGLKQYAKALEETDNTNILHCMKVNGKLYKAKELIKEMLSILPKENIEGVYEITEEAEQFIREEENESRPTFTGHIVVSSLCKSAVERIAELEKENAELKEKVSYLEDNLRVARKDRKNLQLKVGKGLKEFIKDCPYSALKFYANGYYAEQLTKAKEIIKDYITIAKGNHTTVCGVSEENRTIYVLKLNEEAEEFLNSEVEQ